MRRAKWGVGAAVVVGLAWLFSNLPNWNLGGIGSNDGARIGLPTDTSVSETESGETKTVSPPAQTEPMPTGDQTVSMLGPEKQVGTNGVVEVLVDGRNYSLRRGTGADAEWIAAEPDVIASYAKQAKGDETGVRVRVFRRPSALALTEEKLAEELHAAGVTPAEIDFQEQLLKE